MQRRTVADKLGSLFSRKVLLRRFKKNRLKVSDFTGIQSTFQSDYLFDRFRRLHSTGGAYGGQGEYQLVNRLGLYMDYNVMDNDPIISSALDIIADESTLKNTEGDLLKIMTDNESIRQDLENLYYDILNVEHTLWPNIRNLCKYGDSFWYLDIDPKYGIKNIVPISPELVQRIEIVDDGVSKYYFKMTDSMHMAYVDRSGLSNDVFQNYQVAHFRLLSDINYLPYGKSYVENARKIFKQLTLMEDAMMLVRIMRAPERRVFYIDVGNLPPEEVDAHIEQVKASMQKAPYIDKQTGDYNLRYNMMTMLEDFFIPVRGERSGTSIDTLPGLASSTQVEDIEYLKKKLMSALKVPPAFLGYDSDLGGRATLAALDIRFARTIERIQKVVQSELRKIGIIHLYVRGYSEEDIMGFDISLTTPSIVYERQKIELMKEQMDLIESMLSNNMYSKRYIYENILGLSDSEWKEMQNEMKSDNVLEFTLSELKSTGKLPNTDDKESEDTDEEDEKPPDEDNKSPDHEDVNDVQDGRSKNTSARKVATGADETGMKDHNNSVNPMKNPLGPNFYKTDLVNSSVVLDPNAYDVLLEQIEFMNSKNLHDDNN